MDMSSHLRTRQLITYSLPAMAMMVFTSIYGVVDGLFVSNFAGKTAFAAVNLIMPFIMIVGTVGFMMGSGGSALISKARGEGDGARANRYFSLFVYFTAATGTVLAVIGFAVMEDVARALGASAGMLGDCVVYGRISMVSIAAFMLQYAFQMYCSTAGKPKLGLAFIITAGVANMVLDAVFVGAFGWGVAGAAWATVISEFIGGLAPVVYFARKNDSYLRLGRAIPDLRVLGHAIVNGSSEMMANIALSVVSIVYNLQLMAYLGEDGVAAYGTIMYAFMIFAGVFEGYCMGVAPIMSYQDGAKNNVEKNSLFKRSMRIIIAAGVLMFVLAQILAWPLAFIFGGYDAGLLALTEHAMRLFSISLFFMGVSMYASSLFTSLGDGVVSAAIAFLRSLVFEVGSVLLLPLILGADGIWLSVVVAEIVSVTLAGALMYVLGPKRGFLPAR